MATSPAEGPAPSSRAQRVVDFLAGSLNEIFMGAVLIALVYGVVTGQLTGI